MNKDMKQRTDAIAQQLAKATLQAFDELHPKASALTPEQRETALRAMKTASRGQLSQLIDDVVRLPWLEKILVTTFVLVVAQAGLRAVGVDLRLR